MYAIIECGGRQYRAEEGHSLAVEKLPYEVGEQIELENVLLIAHGDVVTVGQPTVAGASVKATVTEQFRGKKILVWKYKPKNRYRRRQGHRQSYTRLRIDSIVANGAAPARPAAERDDLTKIEGIGPKIRGLLHDAGIATFADLADTAVARLQAILDEAGGQYRTAVPESWPDQAKLAAAGDWDALQALQDRLEGGRYA